MHLWMMEVKTNERGYVGSVQSSIYVHLQNQHSLFLLSFAFGFFQYPLPSHEAFRRFILDLFLPTTICYIYFWVNYINHPYTLGSCQFSPYT